MLLAILYFVAASFVFPRSRGRWASLDDHYWARKRLVVGVMLFVNLAIIGGMLTRGTPAWNDWWFYFYFPGYVVPLAGLALSRSRRLDVILLAWLLFNNLAAGFDLFPPSQFGAQVGLGSAQTIWQAGH